MPNHFYSIERPRKQEKLPEVLSKEEIKRMIQMTKNLKHRCMISLLYSAGLRRGELLNLKIADIDSQRMVIKVVMGKGNKDRFTLLGEKMLSALREYYRQYRPSTYLFEGPAGQQYSGSSVMKIVKRAAHWAGVQKRVTPHMLRHSFATAPAARAFVRGRHRSEIYSGIVRPQLQQNNRNLYPCGSKLF
jgi:site-specific recombinase XerD